jgi:hypothetical protein
MNALVVHYARYGNTRSMAHVIADVLADAAAVQAVSVDELAPEHLRAVDFLVAGSPTHKMNLPAALRSRLGALPRGLLRGVGVAAFDASYRLSPFLSRFTAARRLNWALCRLGGRKLVPPQSFCVEGREGPVCTGEADRARAWAETISECAAECGRRWAMRNR